jgi:hypothetical protein
MTDQDLVHIEVDCHAYPWHRREDWMGDDYPEVGPDNLVRMAETYGVLVRFIEDHPHRDWAHWYEIKGPRANVVRLLAAEYCGGTEEAEETVAGMNPACAAGPVAS